MNPRLARSCTNTVFSPCDPSQAGRYITTGYRERCDETAAFRVALVRTQRAAEKTLAPSGRYGARPSPLPGSAGYQICTETGQPPRVGGSDPGPIPDRTVPT